MDTGKNGKKRYILFIEKNKLVFLKFSFFDAIQFRLHSLSI